MTYLAAIVLAANTAIAPHTMTCESLATLAGMAQVKLFSPSPVNHYWVNLLNWHSTVLPELADQRQAWIYGICRGYQGPFKLKSTPETYY